MDLTQSIVPNSTQLNADDLMAGPITVTIKDVTAGSPEQPFNVNLVEYPGRAYRPSKSMRRVMVIAWGAESSAYTGRQLTLYRNPDIMFGGIKVGGIEISALSDIADTLTIPLTVTRGKRKGFTVKPLATVRNPVRDWLAELELAGTNLDAIEALGRAAGAAHAPEMAAIRTRYTVLNEVPASSNDVTS